MMNYCCEVFSQQLCSVRGCYLLPSMYLYNYGIGLRDASHIDFVHDKRHMDVGERGGGGGGACDVSR